MPPLPDNETLDITTAFDIIEHLDHPVEILRWLPTQKLIVTVPNAVSPLARRMEQKNKSKHLFSFTPYTISVLLAHSGWGITKMEYQFGKWSLVARTINLVGSLLPSHIATGITVHCDRSAPKKEWNLV